MAGSIDMRIKDYTKTKTMFINVSQTQASRDKNCWASMVDTTFASAFNSSTGTRMPVNLISSQFGISATHYTPPIGSITYFVDNLNAVHGRKIIDAQVVGANDITVVKFETPLPSTIHPAKLLPSSYNLYSTSSFFNIVGGGLSVAALDQENKILVSNLRSLGAGPWVSTDRPLSGDRQYWYEEKIAGDSGHAIFMIYGDVPILLAHTTYAGTLGGTDDATGPAYHKFLTIITNAIIAMGGENTTLNILDLGTALSKSSVIYTIRPRPIFFETINNISLHKDKYDILHRSL